MIYRQGRRNKFNIYLQKGPEPDHDADEYVASGKNPYEAEMLVKHANKGLSIARAERLFDEATQSNPMCVCGHTKSMHALVAGQGCVGPCLDDSADDTCTAFEEAT